MNDSRQIWLFLPLLLAVFLFVSGCSSGIKGFREFTNEPDSWNMFRNSVTGCASDSISLGSDYSLLWEKKFKGRLYSTPAINDGIGVMPALDRKIYLFDPETGDGIGKIKIKSASSSPPAIADNFLYVASEKGDGKLRCININNGKIVWEKNLGDVSAPIILYENLLLIGNYAGRFYSIDRFNGEINWLYDTGNPIQGGAAVYLAKVYFGSDNGYFYCLDLHTGELIWKFRTSGAIFSTPAVSRLCYITSTDGCLYALDPATGDEVWRFATSGQIFSSPVVDNRCVYFGSNDGCLYTLSLHSGTMWWKFQTGNVVNSTPLVMSNVVVFGSGDANVYFLNKLTGEELFRHKTRSRIKSSPVYYHGKVYIACTEKRLYCFGAKPADSVNNADITP